ncbi:MAG TPA: 50S ribosomal protein L1 [Spirochaetia bacterium]|nr:50S ribosomal protein L1 [Spirochaetia bacterium]
MAHGKKYRASAQKVERLETYALDKAVDLVKEMAYAKFDETVEVSMKLNIKSKHTIRDVMALPHLFGKEKQILVFAKGDKAEEAKKAGAAFVGDNDLIEKIRGGWLDFDIAVATPDMMKDVGKLGQILGRRGLMPNPKTQTVTFNIKEALEELKKGRVEYRADKGGVVHLAVAKLSMGKEQIAANAQAFIQEVVRKRPSDLKGDYVQSIVLSSTMGPGVRLSPKDKAFVA